MSRRKGRFRTVARGLVAPVKKEAPPQPEADIKQKFDIFSELGATGLKRSAGYIQEEFKRELQGQKGAKVYREMVDNSSIIGAALYAVKALVRKAEWKWEPPEGEMTQEKPDIDADPLAEDEAPTEAPEKPAPFAEDKPEPKPKRKRRIRKGQPDGAEFMEQCFGDMSASWPDTLTEVLTFLEYGYSPLEITYKLRGGSDKLAESPGESSRYDDGYVGLRKIALRAQESIVEWIFDEKGGVQGLVQQAAPDYQRIEIPISKLLLFRTTTEKNNPEGRSMLRSAYFDWHFYKRLVEVSAIGAERDLAGLPKVSVPASVIEANGTAATAWRDLAENIRVDEQAGVVIPSDLHPDSKERLYDVELLAGGGSKQFDVKALIERHESRIAMVLGADWLLLGHTETGARSLGETKMDLFSMALESTMDAVCEVINRHLVPRLFELNGWPLDSLPVLKHGNVSKADIAAAVEMLKGLTAAGADIFPDEQLVRHFYGQLKWPTEGREEAIAYAEEAEARAQEALESGQAVNPVTGEPMPPPKPGGPPGAPPPQMAEEEKRKRAMKARHKYSSTQVNLPPALADRVRSLAAQVPDESLAEEGRENRPHITVRYGLHTNEAAEVRAVLAGQGAITASLGSLATFSVTDTGGDYEVLILPVESSGLKRLNALLGDSLAHTDTHPRYTPHVTVAYAKPGTAEALNLMGWMGLAGERVTFDSVTFSTDDGAKTSIPLLAPEPK